jgi:hypothetical protein
MKKLALPILMAVVSAIEFGVVVYSMLSKTDLNKQIPVSIFTFLGVLFFLLSIIFTIKACSRHKEED